VPLNSVQTHVQGLLNGLALPGQVDGDNNPVPLVAYITPPTVEDIAGARAYVWGGTLRERRQTAPRGQGFKTLIWTVDVYVALAATSADPNLDQEFPLVLDAIMQAMRAAPMPIPLTDATTGVVSQLLAIGEDFDLEYVPERLLGQAAMDSLWYSARIGATVQEQVQA
jgi:hypothetical protein